MNLLDMIPALQAGEGKKLSFFTEEKLAQIRTHPFYAPQLENLHCVTEEYDRTPISTVRYSWFKLYDENGSRLEYENAYKQRRRMLTHFFMEYLLFGTHLSQVEDLLWAICDEYTWSLTAHLWYGGTNIPAVLNEKEDGRGLIRSHYREQAQMVDLTSATTAADLAEVVYLLEDKLSPAVVYRVRREIRRRVLEPFTEINEPFWWEYTTNNWGAVCAGNIGMAAMYLIPESKMLAPILVRSCQTMECFLRGFLDDGVCTEGLGYWDYGFGNFLLFADLLKRRTNGEIDLFQNEKVHKIALFQQNCFLNGDNAICFSDCDAKESFSYCTTHYLASVYDDVRVPAVPTAPNMMLLSQHVNTILRSFVWSDPDLLPTGVPDGDTVFAKSQWGISHITAGNKKIAFAAKGGTNAESHNHNDLGSFVYDVDSEVLLGDLGTGLYNKEYFSEQRYTFLATGSQGHPVPIIDGTYQQEGAKHAAKDFYYVCTDDTAMYTAELSAAYDLPALTSLQRAIKLDKRTGALQIEDCFAFAGEALPVTERLITKFPVQQDGNDLLIAGEKTRLRLHTENGAWRITPDSYLCSSGGSVETEICIPVWLLDVAVTDPTQPVRISVQIEA